MRNTEGVRMVSAKPGLPGVFSKGCEVVVTFYGIVEKQNDDDGYDIKIENEAVVGNVRGGAMRAIGVDAPEVKCVTPPDMVTIFFESKKVECNYHGRGKWYQAYIVSIHVDATYDVVYDCGDKESKVEPARIRLLAPPETVYLRNASEKDDVLVVGSAVDARYKGRSRYYLGRVVRVRSNGTFDLDYDDGEKEIGVDRSLIRLIREVTEPLLLPQKNTITDLLNSSLSDITSSSPSGHSPTSCPEPLVAVYTEGDRVEGDFKGKGVWCPGVISCNRDDGTYNIEFDDKDLFKEFKVPPSRIRKVKKEMEGRSDREGGVEESDAIHHHHQNGGRDKDEDNPSTGGRAVNNNAPNSSSSQPSLPVITARKDTVPATPPRSLTPPNGAVNNGSVSTGNKEAKQDSKEAAVADIAKFLRDTGGLAVAAAKRSAEAAYSRDITSVEHLNRMLKVLNFSLESIHITKSQADRILVSIKNSGLSPTKPTPPALSRQNQPHARKV